MTHEEFEREQAADELRRKTIFGEADDDNKHGFDCWFSLKENGWKVLFTYCGSATVAHPKLFKRKAHAVKSARKSLGWLK